MADNAIKLHENDQVTYTITVKRGGSAVDLTAHEASGSVNMYVWEEGADAGTNIVDGVAVTFVTAASGIVSFEFTTTHTALTDPQRSLKAQWCLELKDGAGTGGNNAEKTKPREFLIQKNPWEA